MFFSDASILSNDVIGSADCYDKDLFSSANGAELINAKYTDSRKLYQDTIHGTYR